MNSKIIIILSWLGMLAFTPIFGQADPANTNVYVFSVAKPYVTSWVFKNQEDKELDIKKPISMKANLEVVLVGKGAFITEMLLEQKYRKDGRDFLFKRRVYRDAFNFQNTDFNTQFPVKLTILKAVDYYRKPLILKNKVITFYVKD